MDIQKFVNEQLLKKYKKTASGIYFIYCNANNKIYVGSATKIADRHWQHKKKLTEQKHCNIHLQRAWCKYGPSSFVFGIIELVEQKIELKNREQYWLDLLKSYDDKIGFNICKIAANSLGYKHTEECRARMAALKKGRKCSEEHKMKISKALKGKYVGVNASGAKINESLVIQIKKAICSRKFSYTKIAKSFGINRSIVIHIAMGEHWTHIAPEIRLPILKNGRDPNVPRINKSERSPTPVMS